MTTDVLEPRMDLLQQEYVLVQAWKKTASYIRYHNWFSDTLELDRVAVNLPTFIAEIADPVETSTCRIEWACRWRQLVSIILAPWETRLLIRRSL